MSAPGSIAPAHRESLRLGGAIEIDLAPLALALLEAERELADQVVAAASRGRSGWRRIAASFFACAATASSHVCRPLSVEQPGRRGELVAGPVRGVDLASSRPSGRFVIAPVESSSILASVPGEPMRLARAQDVPRTLRSRRGSARSPRASRPSPGAGALFSPPIRSTIPSTTGIGAGEAGTEVLEEPVDVVLLGHARIS